ncbi:MAG: hypothetical protein IMZ44_05590 [Planctomycetes bacterium]|nr:hypothetical protein [Planctomycetota bacterium]
MPIMMSRETPHDQPHQQVAAEFDRRRRKQVIATALVIVAFVAGSFCWVIAMAVTNAHWLTIVLGLLFWLIALALYFTFSFTNWKCPACRRRLWPELPLKHCVKCGAELRPDKMFARCPNCGRKPFAYLNQWFCSECGSRLR